MADIKTRFTIEGEQQYRKAMSDAANAVKVLNSQQKLAKAQFQNTGDAEKYAAQQADILRKKIEQQKTSVKAAEAALKQLSEQGVAANNRQMQQWQMKLNNAQTALEQMEAELKEVNSTMQETGSAAQETSDAVERIGKKVSYDAVINGLGKISGAAWDAVKKVKELATELVSSMASAASWADELLTTATQYGIDQETLQRMQQVADFIDTPVESIIASYQKLSTNMKYGSQDVMDAFDSLGVVIGEMSAKGGVMQFRDLEDVFWDIGEAIMSLDNEVDREAMGKKLLGSYKELIPLWQAGREAYEEMLETRNVVSKDDVENLGKLDDTIQSLRNEFETLQTTVFAQLAPGFTEIGNTISDLLGEFNKYLQTDEGRQKLSELSDAVTGLFSGLQDVDFGKALDAATGALDSLTNGLEWIKENWGAVEIGLKAIGLVLGGMTVAQPVLTFMQLLSSGKFLFGGGGKSTGSGGGSDAAGAAGGGMLTAIHNAITGAASSVGSAWASGGWSMTAGPYMDWFMNNTNVGRFIRGEESWDDLMRYAQEYGESIKQNAETFTEDWNKLFETAGNALGELGGKVKDKAWEILKSALGELTEEEEAKLQEIDKEINARRIAEGIESFVSGILVTAKNEADPSGWFGGGWSIVENEDLDDVPFLNVTPAQWEAMEEAWDAIRNFGWMSDEGLGALNGLMDRFGYDEEGMQALTEAYEAMRGLAQFGWTGENLPEWWVDREFWPKDEEVDMPVVPTLPEDAAAQMQAVLDGMALTVPVVPAITGGEEGEGRANGLPYVPFDGYPAILHKGERVVPAREISSRSYSSNLYVENMNMNGGADAEGLAAAMAAAQRRTMAGFGS